MTYSGFASLHAGMLERSTAKAGVVGRKTLPTAPLPWLGDGRDTDDCLAADPGHGPVTTPENTTAEKPRRKALTLRLEALPHQRLRAASAATGRSCQDILYAAMNRYLEALPYEKNASTTDD